MGTLDHEAREIDAEGVHRRKWVATAFQEYDSIVRAPRGEEVDLVSDFGWRVPFREWEKVYVGPGADGTTRLTTRAFAKTGISRMFQRRRALAVLISHYSGEYDSASGSLWILSDGRVAETGHHDEMRPAMGGFLRRAAHRN